MNPVVKLNCIDATDSNTKIVQPTTLLEPNVSSVKYWSLLEKVAESQLSSEKERMDSERETHKKNMILLDLKIKLQQTQIEALQ